MVDRSFEAQAICVESSGNRRDMRRTGATREPAH
jgi:hypothetical protein